MYFEGSACPAQLSPVYPRLVLKSAGGISGVVLGSLPLPWLQRRQSSLRSYANETAKAMEEDGDHET